MIEEWRREEEIYILFKFCGKGKERLQYLEKEVEFQNTMRVEEKQIYIAKG